MRVKVKLKEIICHKEGDKGAAEPYLWTIFFKIDSETISYDGEGKFQGQVVQPGEENGGALFHFGVGSHGNLLIESVRGGDTVPIPPNIGEWNTTLTPLKFSLDKDGDFLMQLSGRVGVVAVLLEEDNTIDDAVEAGHGALNNFVKNEINKFISVINILELNRIYVLRGNWFPEYSINNPNLFNTPQEFILAEIGSMTDNLVKYIEEKAQDVVEGAIIQYYRDCTILGDIGLYLGDRDDIIGQKIWRYNQDEIQEHNNLIILNGEPIKEELSSDEWEINGEISATAKSKWLEPFLTISLESQ